MTSIASYRQFWSPRSRVHRTKFRIETMRQWLFQCVTIHGVRGVHILSFSLCIILFVFLESYFVRCIIRQVLIVGRFQWKYRWFVSSPSWWLRVLFPDYSYFLLPPLLLLRLLLSWKRGLCIKFIPHQLSFKRKVWEVKRLMRWYLLSMNYKSVY